jgi:hypothetical protein
LTVIIYAAMTKNRGNDRDQHQTTYGRRPKHLHTIHDRTIMIHQNVGDIGRHQRSQVRDNLQLVMGPAAVRVVINHHRRDDQDHAILHPTIDIDLYPNLRQLGGVVSINVLQPILPRQIWDQSKK